MQDPFFFHEVALAWWGERAGETEAGSAGETGGQLQTVWTAGALGGADEPASAHCQQLSQK